MGVADDLRAAFERSGPIRFDHYMERVLYGPGGFFASSSERAGLLGDFVTSVELGPVFAGVLARRVLGWSTRRPHVAAPGSKVVRVADVGGGRGTLAAQLVSAGGGAIEAASVDRVAGAGALPTLGDLPWRTDVVVAHELLDNLPARLVLHGDVEVRVGFDAGGETCLFHVPLDADLAAFVSRWLPAGVAGVAPVPVGAVSWVAEVAALAAPFVILVDYGADLAELAARPDWPVRGYAGHREVDPIAAPGDTDVTCDVPFDVVEAELHGHGYVTERLRQHDWLARHGIDAVVAAADSTVGPEALRRLRVAEARSQAAELTDPSGLGDFWVLEASLS